MFNGQGAYPPPQTWQQGFKHTPQRTGPPPAKKPKGNPVITRYPPPPGYRGPAAPQLPYQQQAFGQNTYQQQVAWQPQVQPYSYHPPQPSGFQSQPYGVIQPFTQPSFPSYPAQSPLPPTAYPPQPYYQPPGHAQMHGSQPMMWQPQHPAQPGVAQQDWSPPSTVPQKRRHHSAPSLDLRAGSFDLIAIPIPEEDGKHDELDDDEFLGECYFASHPEEIDSDFSLGFILWKAPLPTKRALPSTWAEAELEALAPRKPLPTDDESISDYFIKEKRHEALLSIRQTEYWTEMKYDTLFKELPASCLEVIPISELIARYRNRPDPTWSTRPFSPTPDPEIEESGGANVDVIDVNENSRTAGSVGKDVQTEHTDVLSNLEEAIHRTGSAQYRRHSRASSTASVSSQKITRPTPLMPFRDQAQEDVLASLGVTGSPKLVYQTPGPAVGPSVQRAEGVTTHSSSRNSISRSDDSSQFAPPAPLMDHTVSYSTMPAMGYKNDQANKNGCHSERRGSNVSQHTAPGSDFQLDDPDATPRPKVRKTESRKRSHDSESDTSNDRRLQDDDATPKGRRKQQKTDDPWRARRW